MSMYIHSQLRRSRKSRINDPNVRVIRAAYKLGVKTKDMAVFYNESHTLVSAVAHYRNRVTDNTAVKLWDMANG